MKLYYAAGACSQAPHILLHEIGFSHDAARVDLKSKMVEDGRSYLQVNPKGVVPALELDNGEMLTENAVVLQYLADRSGSPDLLPSVGDFRRYPGCRLYLTCGLCGWSKNYSVERVINRLRTNSRFQQRSV